MAKKKNIIPIKTRGLKDAIEIHKNRTTVDVPSLLEAMVVFQRMSEKLNSNIDDLNEVLHKFSLADIQKALKTTNPCIRVDGITDISFKEEEVIISNVDEKAIMSLGSLVPLVYTTTKTSLNKKLLVEGALNGSLDSLLLPYVGAHTETKLKILTRTVK